MVTSAAGTVEVLDPADGSVIDRVVEASADQAVDEARAAARAWRRTDAADRAAALRRAAAALRERADEIADLQSRENGRPLAESRAGVLAGIGTIEEYAHLGPLHRGESLAGSWGATDLAVHEPRGVAVALVPWNDPVAIAGGPIGACLATGNALIVKPSERAPLAVALVGEIVSAHLPDGVLVVAHGGPATGRALVEHEGVDLVLHTGSVATGREVAATCGRRLVKAVLELGGKDALIVDEDVDPEWAAEQAASGAFANAGQVCTSVERIYAHERVLEAFVAALARRASGLVAGRPSDPATTLGPLIDERQRALVEDHVREALGAGAELVHGGRRIGGGGFFHEPTVLVGAREGMRIMSEETFGPVAAVRAVSSFDEALEAANAGDYGLAATVLTRSQANAQRAWRELDAGTIKVNAVWGGAPGGSAEPRRASGLGLGYGPALLDEVTARKVVHLVPAP